MEQFTHSATPALTTVHFLPPTQPHLCPSPYLVGQPRGTLHHISLGIAFITYTRLSPFPSQDKLGSNSVLPPKSMNKDSLHEREKTQQLHHQQDGGGKAGLVLPVCSPLPRALGPSPDYLGECPALEIIYTQHSYSSLQMSKPRPQVSPSFCFSNINTR